MGGGWFGGGWQGGGWQGGGWQGGGWQGGGGGGGGGPTYAMRADQPLVAKGGVTVTSSKFPDHYWDSDLFALTFLPEFFRATVGTPPKYWDSFITVPHPPTVHPAGYTGIVGPNQDSIDDLRILAVTDRPEAMGEILNQNQDQQLCFMHLMMMTQNSHPKTFFVMKLAARVGEVVMMHLKRHFNRARPSQMFPLLYPPVPVPGHGSYPAGHALIAHLTAKVLIDVTTPASGTSPYTEALTHLAEEIGLNRVIAGLHFRSDIKAGALAGDLTHQFLQGMPLHPGPRPLTPPDFDYASAVNDAKDEWK